MVGLTLALLLCIWSRASVGQLAPTYREGFFNNSYGSYVQQSFVTINTPLSLTRHIGLSFRTCSGGSLFVQTSPTHYSISLDVKPEGLFFTVIINSRPYESSISANFLDNEWHNVNIMLRQGNLSLSASGITTLIANSSLTAEILAVTEAYLDNVFLTVGKGFYGCILQGPSIVFEQHSTLIKSYNVLWGSCPLPNTPCGQEDLCLNDPCMSHGRCISLPGKYLCQCTPRYTGINCQIDTGSPCDRYLCKNDAKCVEDKNGDYTCICPPGFIGKDCGLEITSHQCDDNPCKNNSTCRQAPGTTIGYECICLPGYGGDNCEKNINECFPNPCQHGGTCIDGINMYTCHCGRTGYTGTNCEQNINECENNPCQKGGICFDNYGGYTCQCPVGFAGQNCELKMNDCASSPCNIYPNSICIETVSGHECVCKPGFKGIVPDCVPSDVCNGNNPCRNGGTCILSSDDVICNCPPGFTGVACEIEADHCSECSHRLPQVSPIEWHICNACSSNPCKHATSCHDFGGGGYFCSCEPGWMGLDCDIPLSPCTSRPCLNSASCTMLSNHSYTCTCLHGFTGKYCETNINDCLSTPCLNGGTCFDGVDGYVCNCTSEFMEKNCELKYDICAAKKPCKNNGHCISDPLNPLEYQCDCLKGFEGPDCEKNKDDCLGVHCGDDKFCVDGIDSYECRCNNGLAGPDCNQQLSHCSPTSPCLNGATCQDIPGTSNYTCICPRGFTGRHCDLEEDKCKLDQLICNNGICINDQGSYQCYCQPGYTGDHCDVDIDECLSHPCYNNATCINRVNGFDCVCTPGYTGKVCNVDINECESNPCTGGATCVNSIASFSCICPTGLTGRYCETNIDDCESSPCQNNGTCEDGLNVYNCNCDETGFEGEHCEFNIDDCASNPCKNGVECKDLVKGYSCDCYAGFEGVNCENDINECERNPCKNNGTCLERSDYHNYDKSNYINNTNWPDVFRKPYNFSSAAGFECLCLNGLNGTLCENNINDCESNPCWNGQCVDLIGGYICECEEGFEGINCENNIDECERYRPCVHGTCIDKRAGYDCDCVGKYGGKNCSVLLTGCLDNDCRNNSTCIPYLENEIHHKYNCSCPPGFHGHICEKITTISLNGSSYVMVNTTRDEEYDRQRDTIHLRFKTTLPNGLLAIGKGSTFYILELNQGRLNLHTSLLNKLEGVFIGSKLNDSNWHKVFVAINSSHLVLSANEEQTIYPINLNEYNASHTSFPTIYLGGTISYLRRLTHGPPSFIGCVQDVIINGQWVLPEDSGQDPVSFVKTEVGCKREPQCEPNPCHNNGQCTDLWRNFSCTCQRPYLGHTCQYILTPATFGHDNITDSKVKVIVDPAARRAVRSILDISMFIRTREPSGDIFYLGSAPQSVSYPEETSISAWIYKGELQVQINTTQPEKYTVGGVRLDNGYYHLIQVVRNVTLVQVTINSTEYFRKTISSNGPLDMEELHLGALPTVLTPESRNFKGIIQDVQVSNGSHVMVVEFYPLKVMDLTLPPPLGLVEFDPQLVLEGRVSDDSCLSLPCMHGGTCTVTWNDYICTCALRYKGKQCEDMEFCQVEDCPEGSECRNLNHGYECVANITLHDSHPMAGGIHYSLVHGNMPVAFNDIAISYRSKTGGSLLQVGPDPLNRYLLVTVYKDQISVWWDLGEGPNFRRMTKEGPSGDWLTLVLKMDEQTLTGSIPGDDSSREFNANFSLKAWQSLLDNSNITIGACDSMLATDRHQYNTFEEDHTNAVEFSHNSFTPDLFDLSTAPYRGCIGEVRIGGLLLPFFTASALNYSSANEKDHFDMIALTLHKEQLGCKLCFDNECAHEGKCVNATESYLCQCIAGYEGDDCSKNINECLDSDCKNNSTCIDGINTYTCQCQPGWQGSLCDKEIDECAPEPCLNGGTCKDHLARYECICTPDFVGDTCQHPRLVTCENQPCHNNAQCLDQINPLTNDNFTCNCLEGFVGSYCELAFCEQTPCKNEGFCDSNSMKPVCECKSGYTGHSCEIDIDECASGPCKHGGTCEDGVAHYTCDCIGTGFTGNTCDIDINECTTMDCGLGKCINTIGSFMCQCPDNLCGANCSLQNPCTPSICENGGTCKPLCEVESDYKCHCSFGYGGKNCSQVLELGSANLRSIAIIVGPLVAMLLIAGAASLAVFLMMARKKRATRGTYSPSSQEYCNPRVELDNVMKPPPEERLI